MRWRAISAVGALSAVLAFGGCATFGSGKTGQTWTLSTSPKVPAAVGQVHVKRGDDGNQTIDVAVEHLAAPERVFTGTTHYVVWLLPQGGGPPQNLGVLPIGEDLKGHLTTKTPYTSFDLIVTAEANPAVAQPSPHRVMNAQVRLPS